MSLIDDLVDGIVGFISAVLDLIDDITDLIDAFIDFVLNPDKIGDFIGDELQDIQPFNEVAGALTDTAEEFVLSELQEAGQLTPGNVEKTLDQTEGAATAIALGLIFSSEILEAATGFQMEINEEFLTQATGIFGFGDLLGREIDARLQEGVDPALKQQVHKDHRSKQADFKDWTEANKRAKWVNGDLPTRTGDVPEEVAQLYADADLGYLPDPDTYGTIPDQTPLYEYVGLEHLEPEEIVEEAPQYGTIPSRAAMEQVLHTSGLPEDVKQVYLDLWENIPKSQNPIQESLRLGDVLFQIDQKVMDNVMTPKHAVEYVRSDIKTYIQVSDFDGTPIGDSRSDEEVVAIILDELEHRWELLYNLPNGAPDPAELQSWYEQGQITLEQFKGLWQTFGELGAFWAVYAKETIIDQGEDDIRKAHVLGRLTTQEAMFRLRQKGWSDEQASQILAGADPKTLVTQEAQQQQTVEDLPASALDGISETDQAILEQVGLGTIGAVADASVEELVQTGVVGDETAQKVISQAKRLLQQAESSGGSQ